MWHAPGRDLREEVWEQTLINFTASGDFFQLPGARPELQAMALMAVPLFSVP